MGWKKVLKNEGEEDILTDRRKVELEWVRVNGGKFSLHWNEAASASEKRTK